MVPFKMKERQSHSLPMDTLDLRAAPMQVRPLREFLGVK